MKVTPELLPLIEWWEKDGKQTVIWLLVAAIAVGGWYGWKNYRAAQRVAASQAFENAYTTDEIQEALDKYSGSKTAPALRLRLAKSQFDAGDYKAALENYEALAGNAPDGFEDVPAVGKAQCLEALGQYAEAQKAFEAFAEANPKSFLTLTAQIGAARAICGAGDKTKALARISALLAANKDDEAAKIRLEAAEKVIKRYGQKASPAPAAKPATPAPAAKPATPAPAAKPAPAPAAKPEEKKVSK